MASPSILLIASVAVFGAAWLAWSALRSNEQDVAWAGLQGRYPLAAVPCAPPVLRQSTGVVDGRKVRVRQVLGGTVVEVRAADDLVLMPANADPDHDGGTGDEDFDSLVSARGATWRLDGRARERVIRAIRDGATLESGWLCWPREGWAEEPGEILIHLELALALARALDEAERG